MQTLNEQLQSGCRDMQSPTRELVGRVHNFVGVELLLHVNQHRGRGAELPIDPFDSEHQPVRHLLAAV